MKVLHLLADWKWTGPAEPVLDLCIALRERGVDARFAVNTPPAGAGTSIAASAQRRGFPSLLTSFSMGRWPGRTEATKLRDYVLRESVDLVHAHQSRDHLFAARALRKVPRRPPIVRTNEKAVPLPSNVASRYLFRNLTDGYVTYSQPALEKDSDSFGLKGRSWRIDPAMAMDRFDPSLLSARSDYGIEPEAFVIGVVARMQRHRRFDVLLEGVKRAKVPGLRVLIVGRGTNMEEVAVRPAKKLGLDRIVTFTGYVGEKYLNVVSAFDALLFLVPGSDGTCRAIREAMAMGKAVIGARRGMIPEIVEHESSGLVVDDTPENLARAIEDLATDRARTRKMGDRGRKIALQRFDLAKQAERMEKIYEEILTLRR